MIMTSVQILMSNTAGFVQIVNVQSVSVNAHLSMPNVYVAPIINVYPLTIYAPNVYAPTMNVYAPTIYAPAFYEQTTNILQQQAQQNMLPVMY